MKVISRERNKHGIDYYTTYKFNTGHEFRQWDGGSYFGYTPKGNYTSTVTTHKLARVASEYEDTQVQTDYEIEQLNLQSELEHNQ